jgi:4-oxalocrotonate tautomerase
VAKHAGADLENVTVQIVEAPLHDKMKGGKTFVERRAAAGK